MRTLFIGGPRDGQWLEVPDAREMIYFAPIDRNMEHDESKPETYRLNRWRYACGGRERKDVECCAYVHESVVNPVEALISGCRPGAPISAELTHLSSIDMRRAVLAAVPSDSADARQKVNQWHHEKCRRDQRVTIILPREVAP